MTESPLRAIPESLDPAVILEIDSRLARIATEVSLPWAIESGSRAWGFPSPDSDYDCRFIYVRKPDQYLELWPSRDVIETPLDKTFDVNGWDLSKAVRLLVKGNATVAEWLRSPIVYRGDERFRDALLELAASVAHRGLIGRHYLHVGRHQWLGPGLSPSEMPLKRVFYSLRPASSLKWLRENPGEAVPPMDLPTLLVESATPADVVDEARDLIALKATTRELGVGAVPPAIVAFITAELDAADELYERIEYEPTQDAAARANDWFRWAIREFG